MTSRWDWDPAEGPRRLHTELAASGISWLRAPQVAEAAPRDPWGAAAQLLGERPELVERQPIRPVPNGRSFASGTMAAPFHSDSQTFLGVPPHVQVMACLEAAPAGGESLYLDTWPVLATIEAEAPELFARLFDTPRQFPFVFGDFFGPTVSLRGGSLVFTHTAFPEEGDDVARELQPFLESAEILELRAEPGDVVVAHNHRLLHGRRAFDGERREFTRLLVWRQQAFPSPAPWRERAEGFAAASRAALSTAPLAVRERLGLAAEPDPQARQRLRAVLDLLRGVPAGVLSAREGIPEPQLYRWRSAALSAALTALCAEATDEAAADDAAIRVALAQLARPGRRPPD